MKLEREMMNIPVSVPTAVLELAELDGDTELEMRVQEKVLTLMPAQMTALELAQASAALYDLATELFEALVEACGPCYDCTEDEDGDLCCPVEVEQTIQIPEWVLEEAGIPKGARLECLADPDTGEVHVQEAGVGHDLSEVPPALLCLLREKGVCFRELAERLAREDVVYGEG